jgi:hypothetical protein
MAAGVRDPRDKNQKIMDKIRLNMVHAESLLIMPQTQLTRLKKLLLLYLHTMILAFLNGSELPISMSVKHILVTLLANKDVLNWEEKSVQPVTIL